MIRHVANLALVLSLAPAAEATTGLFTNIHHQYESIRALGMGDAFDAVANDSQALFYNPAAYARMQESQTQLALVDANMSTGFPSFYSQIQGIEGNTNIANTLNTLSGDYGNQYLVRAKVLEVDVARPGWGFAFVPADVTIDLAVNNAAVPAVDVRAYGDTTLAYAYSQPIHNDNLGALSWGITLKGIEREFVSTEVNALDLSTNSNALQSALSSGNLSDGFTADIDLGFLFTPLLPTWMPDWIQSSHPTFALVGRNLADYGFTTQFFKLANQSGTPEQLYRVFDVGSKFELPHWSIFSGRFAIDERDMGHPQFNWERGLHAGFEFDWTMANWWKGQWRAGFGEGYWSAGFSALFSVFRLDLATYGEDYGTYNNPAVDRIVAVRMAMEF